LKPHPKLAGHTAQTLFQPNLVDHGLTLLFGAVLISRLVSPFPSAYQPTHHPSAGLWNLPGHGKPAKLPAAFPQPLENAPAHLPRFPQLPQPPRTTRNRSIRSKPKCNFANQVTRGWWHLSDPGLVALRH
jgi:hypothetical protein